MIILHVGLSTFFSTLSVGVDRRGYCRTCLGRGCGMAVSWPGIWPGRGRGVVFGAQFASFFGEQYNTLWPF